MSVQSKGNIVPGEKMFAVLPQAKRNRNGAAFKSRVLTEVVACEVSIYKVSFQCSDRGGKISTIERIPSVGTGKPLDVMYGVYAVIEGVSLFDSMADAERAATVFQREGLSPVYCDFETGESYHKDKDGNRIPPNVDFAAALLAESGLPVVEKKRKVKVYARQVDPALQESPLCEDFLDSIALFGIAVFGNRRYRGHIPEVVATAKEVLKNCELADILDNIETSELYKDARDAIEEFLPCEKEGGYTNEEIEQMSAAIAAFADSPNSILADDCMNELCKVLAIMTGQEWTHGTIRGSAQGEWQIVCYPVDDWSDDALSEFEAHYFNTGSEWLVACSYEPLTPENIDAEETDSVYCTGHTDASIRKEIADYCDMDIQDVVLFELERMRTVPVHVEK